MNTCKTCKYLGSIKVPLWDYNEIEIMPICLAPVLSDPKTIHKVINITTPDSTCELWTKELI